MNAEIKMKSLAKAMEVLNCFIAKPELGVTEISERLGLYKSTVHNILRTLKTLDYVEQNAETGKYRLGIRVMELSRSLGDRFSVRKVAIPFLQEIANATRERVYLAVPRGGEVLYLEAMYPAEDFSLARSLMGVRARMYCTALGKAMMAFLPAEERDKYASEPMEAFTENTITDKATLLRELEQVRQLGYATDNMEHEYGVKCVAVPIFDQYRQVCGAISVSGPSLRFGPQAIAEYARLLKGSVQKIEQRI